MSKHADHWLVNEILLKMRRVFKRLDQTARSIFALIEPGSCFAGSLLELELAADRSYMLDDADAPDSHRGWSAQQESRFPQSQRALDG